MRFNKVSHLLCLKACMVSMAFAPLISQANESEKAPDEAAAGPEMSKDQREYNEKTAKLSSLKLRIEEGEKHFHELVRSKAEAKLKSEKQTFIRQMTEVATQRNKDVEAYNKLKSEVTYRYPYQGEILNRRYETQKPRSVEELESAGGLDDLLTRTGQLIRQRYAPFLETEDKPAVKPSVAQPAQEKPKRLRLER